MGITGLGPVCTACHGAGFEMVWVTESNSDWTKLPCMPVPKSVACTHCKGTGLELVEVAMVYVEASATKFGGIPPGTTYVTTRRVMRIQDSWSQNVHEPWAGLLSSTIPMPSNVNLPVRATLVYLLGGLGGTPWYAKILRVEEDGSCTTCATVHSKHEMVAALKSLWNGQYVCPTVHAVPSVVKDVVAAHTTTVPSPTAIAMSLSEGSQVWKMCGMLQDALSLTWEKAAEIGCLLEFATLQVTKNWPKGRDLAMHHLRLAWDLVNREYPAKDKSVMPQQWIGKVVGGTQTHLVDSFIYYFCNKEPSVTPHILTYDQVNAIHWVGTKVVITGNISTTGHGKKRNKNWWHNAINQAGGTARTTVSKDVDYVVFGDNIDVKLDPSQKAALAISYGIPLIREGDFCKAILNAAKKEQDTINALTKINTLAVKAPLYAKTPKGPKKPTKKPTKPAPTKPAIPKKQIVIKNAVKVEEAKPLLKHVQKMVDKLLQEPLAVRKRIADILMKGDQ